MTCNLWWGTHGRIGFFNEALKNLNSSELSRVTVQVWKETKRDQQASWSWKHVRHCPQNSNSSGWEPSPLAPQCECWESHSCLESCSIYRHHRVFERPPQWNYGNTDTSIRSIHPDTIQWTGFLPALQVLRWVFPCPVPPNDAKNTSGGCIAGWSRWHSAAALSRCSPGPTARSRWPDCVLGSPRKRRMIPPFRWVPPIGDELARSREGFGNEDCWAAVQMEYRQTRMVSHMYYRFHPLRKPLRHRSGKCLPHNLRCQLAKKLLTG